MNIYRYPNINGATEKEQLRQIKAFLYQLVDTLNYSALAQSRQTQEQPGESSADTQSMENI